MTPLPRTPKASRAASPAAGRGPRRSRPPFAATFERPRRLGGRRRSVPGSATRRRRRATSVSSRSSAGRRRDGHRLVAAAGADDLRPGCAQGPDAARSRRASKRTFDEDRGRLRARGCRARCARRRASAACCAAGECGAQRAGSPELGQRAREARPRLGRRARAPPAPARRGGDAAQAAARRRARRHLRPEVSSGHVFLGIDTCTRFLESEVGAAPEPDQERDHREHQAADAEHPEGGRRCRC